MGRFVNPDNSAFQVALNSKIYIDKTGLIEYTNSVLDTTDAYICNSRPRRFGKSYAANMLAAYYSKGCNSEKMFSDLEISKKTDFKKHLNKYDVIHIDIQWFLSNCNIVNNVLTFIYKSILDELREIYPDIIPLENIALPDCLSRIKNKTGHKFIIIIDEWDVLIRDESSNQKIQDEYINFLRALFKGIEPTKYIRLAYLTGILPIKKNKTQSALNNFNEFTMLNSGTLAPYIGFTENEVKCLCNHYNKDYIKLKHWYDGYILNNQHIYNPKAVVSLMLNGQFRSYWSETGSYETIVPLINMNYDGLKNAVIEMLAGNSVDVDVSSFQNDTSNFTNKDDIITYLIHLGYLAYNENNKTAFVPNEEIQEELVKATKKKQWNELLSFQQKSSDLLNATLDMDSDTVAKNIEEIHTEYISSIQYNDENSLSSVIAIAYLSSMQYYFKPVRELPTGRGFADFVYIPKPEYISDYPALVIELKWNKNAITALNQIKDKNYPLSIKQYTGNILLVGINYDKKTKEHKCIIQKFYTD